jgi:excisionase family DNA binding protein
MFNASEGVSRNALNHVQLLSGLAGRLLVSVDQTMRTLCIGRTKLYELIAGGELEIVKIGTATRVVASSIETYVERLRAQAGKRAA